MNISMNEHLSKGEHQGISDRRAGERRQSADKWIYLLRSLAACSWLLFFVALIITYSTSPEATITMSSILVTNADISAGSQSAGFQLTHYLYEILWSSAFTSYLCLVLAKHRSRRQKDSKHLNVTMLLVATFAWATYMLTAI
ncbi:MAG: hypothetical protein ACSHW0_07775 [Thalassotalea sp.]